MTSREILSRGMALMAQNPALCTLQNAVNLRVAASLTWQREEMGSEEHVQFARRNNTPIVPPGHVCHPLELVKRGYIDGVGWPDRQGPKIALFRWPDGNHWYATVDGADVVWEGRSKWNSQQEAHDAATSWLASREKSLTP